MQIISATRRNTLRFLVAGLAAVGLGATAKSLRIGGIAAPQSDQQFLEALATKGGGVVPARATAYRLTAPINLPGGCTLRFAPGASIVWDAVPYAGPRAARGIFIALGNDITLGGPGGGVTIRATRPDADLFALMVSGRRKVTIEQVFAIDCAHVFATAAPDGTPCRDLTIRGGGASFAAVPASPWQAACTVQYTDGFVVEGSRYRNVAHGVQWWGGDGDPKAQGAWANERKCRNGRIEQVTVDNAVGCSVWGSMGEAVRVIDCRGTRAGDVGFDAEGSIDVEFLRCSQTDAKRGCFTTFFFNKSIVFRDCVGVQPRSDQPIFRIYTEVLGGNQDVAILGGKFQCLDAQPATIDDAYGDAHSITIRGATLVNVAIALHFRDHSQVTIENNSFVFAGQAPATFDAVLVRVPVSGPGIVPFARIANNRIVSRKLAPGASIGIRVLRSAGQDTRSVIVSDNRVTGFPTALDAPR